jgi:hypothetical protein
MMSEPIEEPIEEPMSSVVLISGRVVNTVKIKEETAYFSLKSPEGRFFIQATDPAQVKLCQTLTRGEPIVVIGYLGSFIFRRCDSHHMFIRGVRITPLRDVWRTLWHDVAVPLITQSEYTELLRQTK